MDVDSAGQIGLLLKPEQVFQRHQRETRGRAGEMRYCRVNHPIGIIG